MAPSSGLNVPELRSALVLQTPSLTVKATQFGVLSQTAAHSGSALAYGVEEESQVTLRILVTSLLHTPATPPTQLKLPQLSPLSATVYAEPSGQVQEPPERGVAVISSTMLALKLAVDSDTVDRLTESLKSMLVQSYLEKVFFGHHEQDPPNSAVLPAAQVSHTLSVLVTSHARPLGQLMHSV